MEINEISNIIQKCQSFNINEFSNFKIILEFLRNLENNHKEILDKYEASNVRFCDYYDEHFNFDELTNYFKDNYLNNDKDEQYIYFILYSIIKKCVFLIEALTIFEQNEVVENFSSDIKNVTALIKEFHLLSFFNRNKGKNDLNFDNHKYRLLFAGFSLDDILFLDKKIIKALVNKINNFLLELDMVSGVESVSHVKDKFNVPLLRIQLADDYRISFIRRNRFTIILGVELKSGKDSDYTRYDSVAKKIDSIYLKCDLLNKDELPCDDMHYKVIEEIKNKLGIKQDNEDDKNTKHI